MNSLEANLGPVFSIMWKPEASSAHTLILML